MFLSFPLFLLPSTVPCIIFFLISLLDIMHAVCPMYTVRIIRFLHVQCKIYFQGEGDFKYVALVTVEDLNSSQQLLSVSPHVDSLAYDRTLTHVGI